MASYIRDVEARRNVEEIDKKVACIYYFSCLDARLAHC